MKLVFAFVMALACGCAQTPTAPKLDQIAMPAPVPGSPVVIAYIPGVGIVGLALDTSVQIDTTAHVIRAVVPAAPAPPSRAFGEAYAPTAAQTIFTLKHAGVIAATISGYWNGVRLTALSGYTVNANAVTFTIPIPPGAGDVVAFDYEYTGQ